MKNKPDKTPQVAFQGVEGAYSELAAANFFGPDVKTAPKADFAAVFAAVVQKKAAYGILPVENSLTGSIHQNYDLLLANPVEIIGEVKLPVSHCLLAARGVQVQDLQAVYSHPQALAQCGSFLQRELPQAVPTPYFDTAGSAKYIAESQLRSAAAIASAAAGKRYGLTTLRSGIEDHQHNFTRFIVIRLPKKSPKGGAGGAEVRERRGGKPHKTSVVFSLKSTPGALHKCLSVFAIRDLDLLKIESRPIPGQPWQYMFYLDFAAPADPAVTQRVLGHLEEITDNTRLLGTYVAV